MIKTPTSCLSFLTSEVQMQNVNPGVRRRREERRRRSRSNFGFDFALSCRRPLLSHTKVNREKFTAPKVLGALRLPFSSSSYRAAAADAIKSLFVAECR